MKSLYLLWHLGLGDAVVCNGLVRYLAERWGQILLPVKRHNIISVASMFADLTNVHFITTVEHKDATWIGGVMRAINFEVMDISINNADFNREVWDQEFYRLAGVPIEAKRGYFKIPKWDDDDSGYGGSVFVHDDRIPRQTSWEGLPVFVAHRLEARSFLEYLPIIQNAKQIHCIDSSFLSLCDLVETKAEKYVLHKSLRDSIPPTKLYKPWEIV